MPPETDEYRRINPNSPFRTAAIGTKVNHKQDNTEGEIVGQEHDNFRVRWNTPTGTPSTWHNAAVLDIHWGTEPKHQRGDVVTFPGKDDRYVVTRIEEDDDLEAMDEGGSLVSLVPQSVRLVPNMRERGVAVLALQERRKNLTEALDAEDEQIEQANQMIREAQDRRDAILHSKGLLADLVDEMLHDS